MYTMQGRVGVMAAGGRWHTHTIIGAYLGFLLLRLKQITTENFVKML